MRSRLIETASAGEWGMKTFTVEIYEPDLIQLSAEKLWFLKLGLGYIRFAFTADDDAPARSRPDDTTATGEEGE